MKEIEFTTTHVGQRHEIIKKTYLSFFDNLVDVDFAKSTIYINVDSTPNLAGLVDESDKTIEFLEKYFGKVVSNITGEGNFTKALQWCWGQPKGDFFYHIEDDWILNRNISLDELFPFFNDENVFAVNLRAYHFAGPRPCLLPALYRSSFCKKFIEKLNEYRNPENQLRSYVSTHKKFYNIHYPEDIQDIILKDIGREWLRHKGLKRNQISSKFIKYQKAQ